MPGLMLEQLVFSHLVPNKVIERFEFPSESEDNPQKREVYRDGQRELPEDVEEEAEEQEKEAVDEDEDQDETEDKVEVGNEDLVTVMQSLQL